MATTQARAMDDARRRRVRRGDAREEPYERRREEQVDRYDDGQRDQAHQQGLQEHAPEVGETAPQSRAEAPSFATRYGADALGQRRPAEREERQKDEDDHQYRQGEDQDRQSDVVLDPTSEVLSPGRLVGRDRTEVCR
jgi:hypothetical protein